MTMRLSISAFAGTARTDVAVGTSIEASMFCTILAAMPLSGVSLSSAAGTSPRAPSPWSRGVGSGVWPSACFGSSFCGSLSAVRVGSAACCAGASCWSRGASAAIGFSVRGAAFAPEPDVDVEAGAEEFDEPG